MKSFIRKILAGDNAITEYSKITVDGEIREKVYFEVADNIIDVSQTHWILCIKPVVFGIWIEQNEAHFIEVNRQCHLYFCDAFSSNIKKDAMGVIALDYFDCIKEKEGSLFLFKVKSGGITHLNFIKRFLLFNRYYKKNGLTVSKFKSFVAAYSYPRKIRIISFMQNDYYNIFPMDLLGDIKKHNRYVFGLRHTNVSLQRIINTGKLVVSEVSFKYKDLVFELGKHHSSKPLFLSDLPFSTVNSETFGFPVPNWVDSYKEIKILKTINLGSHMLLWGESVNENIFAASDGHLFLIHFLQYLHQKNKGFEYPLV